jgi:hypothetical protein
MLTFSLAFKTEPVTLADADGNEVKYVLTQMTGAQADAYRASQAAKVKLDGEGNVVEFKDFTGQFVDLLSVCMKKTSGELVSKQELYSWPDDVLKELHKAAAKLNKMSADDDEVTDPKKD